MTIRPDERYWRVRTKYSPTEEDFTSQAWGRDEVEIGMEDGHTKTLRLLFGRITLKNI